MRSNRRADGDEAALRLQAALRERPRAPDAAADLQERAGGRFAADRGEHRGGSAADVDNRARERGGPEHDLVDRAPGSGDAAGDRSASGETQQRAPGLGDAATALRTAAVNRLPDPLRDGVVDPRARGAWTIVAVVVAAAAAAAVVLVRARPAAVPVPPPRLEQPAAGKPSPSAAVLVVDVAGAVRRPGLQRLAAGSRVADAIRAAGGVRRGASTAGLNLARKLVDGEQVFVGAPGVGGAAPGGVSPGADGGAGGPPGPVNLNTATVEQLDALAGVGPVTARRIVEWREAHGGFSSVDQLQEVDGIGERRLASLRGQVTV